MCTNEETKRRVRQRLDGILLGVKVAQTVEGHRDPEGGDAVVEVLVEELMKLHSSYGEEHVGCESCGGCKENGNDILRSAQDDGECAEETVDISPMKLLSFGEALEKAKCGARIARKGWNGKNQYVFLAKNLEFCTEADLSSFERHCVYVHDALAFMGTSGVQVGWLASQADMLSEDWHIVE